MQSCVRGTCVLGNGNPTIAGRSATSCDGGAESHAIRPVPFCRSPLMKRSAIDPGKLPRRPSRASPRVESLSKLHTSHSPPWVNPPSENSAADRGTSAAKCLSTKRRTARWPEFGRGKGPTGGRGNRGQEDKWVKGGVDGEKRQRRGKGTGNPSRENAEEGGTGVARGQLRGQGGGDKGEGEGAGERRWGY